jgi:hypothetical protein
MRVVLATLLFGLAVAAPFLVAQARGAPNEDEFAVLLERLRKQNTGEYDKVVELAKTDRPAAVRFLRERFGTKGEKPGSKTKPEKETPKSFREKEPRVAAPLPARQAVHSGRNAASWRILDRLVPSRDGAFGLGEIRKGKMLLRRADFLITWQVGGKPSPTTDGKIHSLARDPPATLHSRPQSANVPGHPDRVSDAVAVPAGPIVETAS